MKCPLCVGRKAKRFCPAKAAQICPTCCGTKREVEIDCPSDCVYLHSGREYETQRMVERGQFTPTTERLWADEFYQRNFSLLAGLWHLILAGRIDTPEMVDSDAKAVVNSLIRTYQTMESGIYYDHVPDSYVQKTLYHSVKSHLDEQDKNPDVTTAHLKTSVLLDCLHLTSEMISISTLPRPKSRAFLDYLDATYRKMAGQVDTLSSIILP